MAQRRPDPDDRGEQPPMVVQEGTALEQQQGEGIQHPAKVMRIASMARQLLDEVRQAPLDDASRARLKEIYETSVMELAGILSTDLRDELARLSLPFDQESPSDAELRVAHAQLVGWLEGLFHGIQAMLFAQQMESRQRLEEMRRPQLPQGHQRPPAEGGGTYL
ncbi:MAG: proteasome activator [Actinomycetota bacterium]